MINAPLTTDERFVNGARVSNQQRLFLRSNFAASLAVPRPESNPDAIGMARMHPNKGWARRYLRARGLKL